MSEVFTNLATTTISGTLSASATSVTVAAGKGALFPAPTGAEFFRVVMIKLSTGEYEIAKVTSRTGDSLSFGVVGNRGIEGTTALAFNDGDIIELRPTAAFFSSLLTDADMQENTPTYAADTGSANAYVVTLSPAVTAYTAGLEVKFLASNTNTAASTLNVNGVGATSIKRDASFDLAPNDITDGDIVHVIHDGTNWQMQRLDNRKSSVYLEEQASAPASRTNSIAVFSQDVSTVTGLFVRPDGGAAHQIPFPYNTIITAEWDSAPAGWEFQSQPDDAILLTTNELSKVGDTNVTVTDSYGEANQNATTALNDTITAAGQSITGDGGELTGVQLYLSKTGSPTGTAVAKLYAHSGVFGTSSVPTGGVLATSETIDVSELTTSLQLIRFNFDTEQKYTLVNATNYVIVIEYTSGTAVNYVNVGTDTTTPSHGGNFSTYDASWTAVAGTDAIFYVYTNGSWAIEGLVHDHTHGGPTDSASASHTHTYSGTTSQQGRNQSIGQGATRCTDQHSHTYSGTTSGSSSTSHSHPFTTASISTTAVKSEGLWRPPYRKVGRFKYVG